MAQQAQGTKKPGKFNWLTFILTIVFIAGAVTLLVWFLDPSLFHKSIPHKTQTWFLEQITNANGKQIFKSVKLGPLVRQADVIMSDNKHYIVDVTTTALKRYGDPSDDLGKELIKITKVLSPMPIPKTGRSVWIDILISLLPMFLMGGLLFFFMKKAGGGQSNIFSPGRNQARKIISKTKFTDVAGQQEVKEEISEVVDFLKNPKKYESAGAKIPKGILLGGPPGTGKTLLAKATAGEANVPFFFIAASNFVELFAGVGAKRVREMFKDARKSAPAILFIDELDAIGRKRGSSISGNDEREQTLNQILVEMDGMEENGGLVIIAATNRPDVLDPALLRPGRFDRTITVGNPDIKERELILELHAKGKRISKDVKFSNIAKRTPGYSGAQLANIINEAALLSVREKTEVITIEQIDEAIDRVVAGPAKKHRVITREELKMVSYHEAGHAVIGLKVSGAELVQKITIIPRGQAGGYTLMTPKKETYNFKKSELIAKITSYMGGRAAEQIIYGSGEVSTGAANDIERATNIARSMVTQYGMSILGPIAYEKAQGPEFLGAYDAKSREYSDALAEKIDEAVRNLVLTAEKKAIDVIKKNKKLLKLISEELLEKETIVLEEIEYINKYLKRPPKKAKKSVKKSNKSIDQIIDEVKKTSEIKKPKSKTNSNSKTNSKSINTKTKK